MRVIAGKAKGRKLITPQGEHTRPTSDRIKETLFNIIQSDVYDSRFLDLFSGSGGIAIEALSRGAKEAVLVDNNREAAACIRENIKKTNFSDIAKFIQSDVKMAIKRLSVSGSGTFDIIFMDPPYNKEIEREIIEILIDSLLVKEGTLIIAETSIDTDISYIYNLSCKETRVKEYKTNRHVFLKI